MTRVAYLPCLALLPFVACATPSGELPLSASTAAATAEDLQMRLGRTLNDLAAFGNKRAGTEADKQAAHYLRDRWRDAGLSDVHLEEFFFPMFEVASSSLAVSLDGVGTMPTHEVLGYSGTGQADADVVYVGRGHPADYEGRDVRGKVVLVDRDARFHRATQLKLVAQHGGIAMLWASTAPNDLIQIGTVSLAEGSLGAVPAVSLAASDARRIRDTIAAGRPAHATLDVNASIREAMGRNLVGTLPGSDPSGAYFVVGAHYDTWYTGSYDNGAGVAATITMAEDFARIGGRKKTLRFVAYDAEEVGLFGGYDYLRKHVVAANEPMLGFVNLETPANDNDGTKALAHTNGSPFHPTLVDQGLQSVYPSYIGMEILQPLFGGVIPTDIQGMYRYGLQGATTFADSPYYHTKADTPDKVNLTLLSSSVTRFEAVLDVLDNAVPASFQVHDPTLWRPTITTYQGTGSSIVVNVVAKDAAGNVQAGANVEAWVDARDFTTVARKATSTDATGAAQLVLDVDPSILSAASLSNWLHVTTGKTFPLSEMVTPARQAAAPAP